jgi:hypothetical protein
MQLMLFLGSGISIPSDLPSVRDLTSSVLNGDWHLEGLSFHRGPPTELADPTRDVQAFLKLLKSYADGYFALRGGQEANYEDVFYLWLEGLWDQRKAARSFSPEGENAFLLDAPETRRRNSDIWQPYWEELRLVR